MKQPESQRRTPNIGITTPDTLLLGIWHEAGRCAITGAVRTIERWENTEMDFNTVYEQEKVWGGEIHNDVLDVVSDNAWQAINQALTLADVVGARNVLMLCNDQSIVRALSKPLSVPTPDSTAKEWYSYSKADIALQATVGVGGDKAHWNVLRLLAMRRWAIRQETALPGAKALWANN